MTTLIATKLTKFIIEGPVSSKLSATKITKWIVEDTSSAIVPPRKRAPQVYIRYGDDS